MLTKEVRKHEDRKDMVTFDFQPQLGRITEDTAGEFHDNTNKVDGPKEGEVLGLQPSYSAAELYVAITPRQSAWGFERESLFDQFIGNVGEILASCKQHGASRAAARPSSPSSASRCVLFSLTPATAAPRFRPPRFNTKARMCWR